VHCTFQIKCCQTLLFCSDVVHCGGHPGVDQKTGANYYWLHFYLQTEFQMAPDNEVNCLTVNCSVDDVVEVDGMHCWNVLLLIFLMGFDNSNT